MKKTIMLIAFLVFACCMSEGGGNRGNIKKISVGGFLDDFQYIEIDNFIYLQYRRNEVEGLAYVGPRKGFPYKYKQEKISWWSSYDYVQTSEHIFLKYSYEESFAIAHAGICPCMKK